MLALIIVSWVLWAAVFSVALFSSAARPLPRFATAAEDHVEDKTQARNLLGSQTQGHLPKRRSHSNEFKSALRS
jgi:hypothetical protein